MNPAKNFEQMMSQSDNIDVSVVRNRSNDKKHYKLFGKPYLRVPLFTALILICVLVLYLAISKSIQCSTIYRSNRLLNQQIEYLEAEENDIAILINNLHRKRSAAEQSINLYSTSIEKLKLDCKKVNDEIVGNKEQLEKYKKQLSDLTDRTLSLQKERDSFERAMSDMEKQISEYTKQISEIKSNIENETKKQEPVARPNSPIGMLFESKILEKLGDVSFITQWIGKFEEISLRLLYRASTSKFSIKKFHSMCDYLVNPLLILVRSDNGFVVGGYTTQNTSGKGIKEDKNAFIFNLSKLTKYNIYYPNEAIYTDDKVFIVFGQGDIHLEGRDMTSKFPMSYGSASPVQKCELTNGYINCKIDELEAYEVLIDNKP